MTPTALLINASPKAGRSTSHAIAEYLGKRLNDKGVEIKMRHIGKDDADLVELMDISDIVVFASPLYVDSLPSKMIALMEDLSSQKSARTRQQTMIAVINCGFPQSAQCATAITICSIFAKRMGFTWAGGLPMGMGEAAAGKTLEEAGGMMRRPRQALDMAADALTNGKEMPMEAVRLMAKPIIPTWLFLMMAERMWKQKAAANGCKEKLGDAPFA